MMGRTVFFEGSFMPLEEAKIGIMTHAFLYGTALFEGIRGYWNEDKEEMFIFRMREHYERMLNSCKILRMQCPYSLAELEEHTITMLKACSDRQDVYIRPIVYKSSEAIGPKLDGIQDDFLLFSLPFGDYLDVKKGLSVRVSSWRHLEDNALPMRGKINGAYVNAALAKSDAVMDGYDEAIFLDSSGHVSEGSAANIFIVRDGKLITPPVTSDILEGITRSTIIELAAAELGVQTVERVIDRTELYICDEAFFVGTGAQVSCITQIDRRPVGTGEIGDIGRSIQKLYFDTAKGRIDKYLRWCTPVYGS